MSNQRRHFRYDVLVPVFFEKVDSQGVSLSAPRREMFKHQEEARLVFLNEQINHVFERVFSQSSEAAMIFHRLNHRMDLIFWMLNHLMDAEDPRQEHDYKFRLREDAKHLPPDVKEGSTIGVLIRSFYNRVDGYLKELNETVNESVDGKIFLFKQDLPLLFNDQDYVKNLKELAAQGVVQAKVLQSLIEKLNLLETIYTRLKLANKGISDPTTWPVEKINLSAGGFSVLTNQVYPGFSHLNVFLGLNEEIIVCRGKIVMNKPTSTTGFEFRVAVEFDFLKSEYEVFITRFVQDRELDEAMKTFPHGVEVPISIGF